MSRPVAAWLADDSTWGGVIRYGPHVADERRLRLLGALPSKRVLVLGCGRGQACAEVARAGAKVIAVDPDAASLEATRRRCQAEGQVVELHQHDLAELAFVRADTIDVIVSVLALATVADLGRVFRQLRRVVRPEGSLVFSLPHPFLAVAASEHRGYGESRPQRWEGGFDHTHTVESVFTALSRAGFRVDTLAELAAEREPDSEYWHEPMARVPAVLVVRGRPLGA